MSEDPRLSELYSCEMACKLLGVSKQYLNELSRRYKRVRAYKVNTKTYLYLKSDVDRIASIKSRSKEE